MAVEIERKFLVKPEIKKELKDFLLTSKEITQGYLYNSVEKTVRVRALEPYEGETKGFITVKGQGHLSRVEYEYAIPFEDAKEMLDSMCESVLKKTRTVISVGEHSWEIDVFHGENDGLIVAEIELGSEDEEFELPDWVDKEITGQGKYLNACLINYPFSAWGQR